MTTVVRAPITLLGGRRLGLWAVGAAVIGSATFLTTVANADAGCRFTVSLPLADGART